MQKRLERIRQRAAIRRWEYRQRRHAHGVWFRLRRILADADQAYVIDDDDTDRLLRSGKSAEPVGAELSPKRTLVFIEPSEIATLPSARRIAVQVPEVVAAPSVALVRF